MGEQQQVRSAKEGSMYLVTLCLILGVLLWTIFQNASFFMPVLLCFVFSYFLYRAISIDAFALVFLVFRKHFKYNQLHLYFQHPIKQQSTKLIWQKKALNTDEQNSPEKIFQPIIINAPEILKKKNLFVYNQQRHLEKTKIYCKAAKNVQRQRKQEQYLEARELYKKTIEDLRAKGLDQKTFEQFIVAIKNSYTQKIKQLLKSSEQNIKIITSTVQENFQVKVLKNQKIPQRLEPVSLDLVILYMSTIQTTKSFPFSPRMNMEFNSGQILNKLVQLASIRNKVDATLCNRFFISNKQRQQIVKKILQQLQQKNGGKELLKVLLQLYNKNIDLQQYKIACEEMNINNGGVKVIESYIGLHMHFDLKLIREGKEKIYRARPGDDNLWSLLSLAAHLYRLKL